MDLVATWDWRAWMLAVLLVVVFGRLLWRYLAALAFRYLLLDGTLRGHGWQADLPGVGGGRAAFREQVRRQRRQGWAQLRRGWGGIREGYRTGVFGKTLSSSWWPELTITGTFRGRHFVASQIRRFELTGGQHSRRGVRRRASLDVSVPCPVFEVRVGLVSGQVRGAPTGLEELLRSRRSRFRVLRASGGALTVPLGPRLRRGQLLAALDHLNDVADRLLQERQ